jgi:hypothetical protein
MEIMEVVWVIVLFWPVFVAVIVSLYSVAIGSEMGEKSSVKLAWLSIVWVITVLAIWKITGVT